MAAAGTTIGGSVWTGREVGRCTSCKQVTVRDTQFWSGSRVTCPCGKTVNLKGIWAKESRTECGPRCTGAVGPSCDCKCSGKNHGAGHGA